MKTRSLPLSASTVALPLLAALALAACGVSLEPPPVEVGARDSLIGAGTIVRIVSTTSEALEELEVEIAAPDGEERTFYLDVLPGYGFEEVGWKKLGGWEVPWGSTVRVRAKGYLTAREIELVGEPPTVLP